MATLTYLFFVLVNLVNQISCHGHSKAVGEHKTLFIFGDSLFDVGNNQHLPNGTVGGSLSWPYGETFFNRPTGRLSDGRLVPDFIAQFAHLPLLPAYLEPIHHRFTEGVNFASAGGAVLHQHNNGAMDLPTQVIHFKTVVKTLKQEIGDAEAEKVLSRAVYLFSNGGNDYFSFSTNNRNATHSQQAQFVGMVIGNLTNILKELYGLGVRKIAFQNVGPLGCTPTMKFVLDSPHASECVEPPLALARLHNKALAEALKNLETKLPGFKYSIFDYYHELLDRIKNPSKYGFENGEIACCGSGKYLAFYCGGGGSGTHPFDVCKDPNEYVWFDGAHTTEKTNNQLAHLIWSGEPHVTGPYNLQQLFHHA